MEEDRKFRKINGETVSRKRTLLGRTNNGVNELEHIWFY